MVASLSFNNIFTNHAKRDQGAIENRIKELEYLVIHQQIQLPYIEDFGNWEIEMISGGKSVEISYSSGDHKTFQKKIWIDE